MKIKILVAAHKKFPMPNAEGYMPILVGAAKNYKPGIEYQRDDEGENISSKNPNYNELTAVYWAWKNLKDVDAIGLVHYRRLFFDAKPYSLDNVLSVEKVEKLLNKYDVILPKKRNYYIETNYSRQITVEEISNHVGINRKYLTKLFNEKMDNSPKNYLIQYRINKACRLLKQSTLSIQEVSHSVGYTDALVFSKIFKKVVGTCPREYRSANFTS